MDVDESGDDDVLMTVTAAGLKWEEKYFSRYNRKKAYVIRSQELKCTHTG